MKQLHVDRDALDACPHERKQCSRCAMPKMLFFYLISFYFIFPILYGKMGFRLHDFYLNIIQNSARYACYYTSSHLVLHILGKK